MKAALIVAASWMLSCAVLQGAEREFSDIVRAISDQLRARPLSIPFFGLVNFAAFVAHPAGVKHIDIAVFDNLDLDERAAGDIAASIRGSDRSWRPFVQVRSWKHGQMETVIVYIRDAGADCKLLVTAIEPEEVTVVELKLNPEVLQVWLNGDRGVKSLRPMPETSCHDCAGNQPSRAEN